MARGAAGSRSAGFQAYVSNQVRKNRKRYTEVGGDRSLEDGPGLQATLMYDLVPMPYSMPYAPHSPLPSSPMIYMNGHNHQQQHLLQPHPLVHSPLRSGGSYMEVKSCLWADFFKYSCRHLRKISLFPSFSFDWIHFFVRLACALAQYTAAACRS